MQLHRGKPQTLEDAVNLTSELENIKALERGLWGIWPLKGQMLTHVKEGPWGLVSDCYKKETSADTNASF